MGSDPAGDTGGGESAFELEERAFPPRRIIRLVLVLAAIGLVLDGIYVAVAVAPNLMSARDELQVARDILAMPEPDLDHARDRLQRARDEAETATSSMGHPAYRLIEVLPWIRDDARAVHALADAGRLAANAGVHGVNAAETLGLTGQGQSDVYVDGRLRFEVLDEVEADVRQARRDLEEAQARLDVPHRPALESVANALADARSEGRSALRGAQRAVGALRLLPELFARDDEKRYLLVFLSPSEARGAGGIVGLQGLLTARDGELDLSTISAPAIAERNVRVNVHEGYRRAYGNQGSFRDARQAVLSPDFPAAARVLTQIYDETSGRLVDGVMAMDPFVLGELLRATGPVRVDGVRRPVTANNAQRTLLYTSYVAFDDPLAQNLWLGQVVDRVWSRLDRGDVDVRALAEAIGRSTTTRHLKLFLSGAAGPVAAAGADGNPATSGAAQMVFHNNYGVNKVDFFLRRSVDTTVLVDEDGDATVTVDMRMENEAPERGPATLLGTAETTNGRPGANVMELNVLMPEGAKVQRWRVGGGKGVPEDLAYGPQYGRLIRDLVQIPPGGNEAARLVYELPGLVDFDDDGDVGVLDLTLFPQPLATPDRYSLSVELPAGWEAHGETDRRGALEEPIVMRLLVSR